MLSATFPKEVHTFEGGAPPYFRQLQFTIGCMQDCNGGHLAKAELIFRSDPDIKAGVCSVCTVLLRGCRVVGEGRGVVSQTTVVAKLLKYR